VKKGTRVSWQVQKVGAGRGFGTTISDEDADGTVLVAVDSLMGEVFPGYHAVIHCATTWLKIENSK
jgi:hypothetical protein